MHKMGFVAQISLWVEFPLPQTDLAYRLRYRYARSCVAVKDSNPDLDLGNLPFKVPRLLITTQK